MPALQDVSDVKAKRRAPRKAAAKKVAPKKVSVRKKPAQSGTINLRADAETRALIDRAAEVSGQNRTEFMLNSARVQAQHVLLSQVYFHLNDADWTALNEALDTPPPANAALKAAFRAKPIWDR
jgi:uncharacterized protein (DUF1778 family)